MENLIGLFGSIFFAISGAPLAIAAIKNKKDETNIMTLVFLLLGAVLSSIYTIMIIGIESPLLLNFGLTIIFISITLFINIKTRSNFVKIEGIALKHDIIDCSSDKFIGKF